MTTENNNLILEECLEFRLFTEASNNIGIMYKSYKEIPDYINIFLNVIEDNIKEIIKNPKDTNIDMNDDIKKFKTAIDKKFEPEAIKISDVKKIQSDVRNLQKNLDNILTRMSKLKNKISFGGNYLRACIIRPKVYNKDADSEGYTLINNNLRTINRAMDWCEKILIDLFNMADQDDNTLIMIDKLYRRHKIYESTDILDEVIDDNLINTITNFLVTEYKEFLNKLLSDEEIEATVNRSLKYGSIHNKNTAEVVGINMSDIIADPSDESLFDFVYDSILGFDEFVKKYQTIVNMKWPGYRLEAVKDLYSCIKIINTNNRLIENNDEEITEASRGKLKFDYRQVFDAINGHRLLCTYTLDGINVTYPGHAWDLGNGYDMSDHTGGDRDKYNNAIKDVQKNISKKGNTDHQSYGQRLIAIKDMETGEQWTEKKDPGKEFKVKGYFSNTDKDPIFTIKLGEIESENNKTYKSTKIFSKTENDPSGMKKLSIMEPHLKYARGAKLSDIKDIDYGNDFRTMIPVYKHPSKKDIKKNPHAYPTSIKDKYDNEYLVIDGNVLRKAQIKNSKAIIPDNIKIIGNSAFSKCHSLESITIPNSVTSIGENAFVSCRSLKSITIPNSVTKIADWAFGYCKSLKSVTIPDSVTEIGRYAFHECESITSVTIPEGITKIDEGVFWKCKSLISVKIPNSVKSIEDGAFYGCESITSVTIPEGITKIGHRVFTGCKSLSKDTISKLKSRFGEYIESANNDISDDYINESNTNNSARKKTKEKLTSDEYSEVYERFGNVGCSFAKDKNGYYCYTHRARSKSYPTIAEIPQDKVDFIVSTG